MKAVPLALAALLLSSAPPAPELRTLTCIVTDEKGAPVEGIQSEEVAVMEDGVARAVARVEPDARPLTLALLIDTSQTQETAYRLNMLDAVTQFLPKLPEKTQFAVWAIGDRPRKIVDYGDDVPAALGALKKVFPQGGNTLLDAIPEATRDLKKKEAERSAVVIMTGLGTDTSNNTQYQAVQESAGKAGVFMVVEFEEGPAEFETRTRYDYTLGQLTQKSGGVYERALSTMGATQALAKVSSALRATYRVSYASGGAEHTKKLEVVVARPGTRVLLAQDKPQDKKG
jgi:VWFA-related protein